MALMPRGAPRSVPDPAGDDYDGMMRGFLGRQTRDDAGGFTPLAEAFRPEAEARSFATDSTRRVVPISQAAALGATPSPRSTAPRPGRKPDNTGYYQLGLEWLTGIGPRRHDFGQDDPATAILRQHDHVGRVRERIANSNPQVDGNPVPDTYSLRGVQGVPDFIKDYAAVPTAGAIGNLGAAYLGSYDLNHTVKGVRNGVAIVDFDARNTSSLASALHPPVAGYDKLYQRIVDPLLNKLAPRGPGSPTEQTFHWTEQIPLRGATPGPRR